MSIPGTGGVAGGGIPSVAAAIGSAAGGVASIPVGGTSEVAVIAGLVSFWKRASTGMTICCSPAGPTSIFPRTGEPGEAIGGEAAETAGGMEGIPVPDIGGGGAISAEVGVGEIGPVAPASGLGAGGAGGGSSSAGSGSSCSRMIPEISLSIICLMTGATASSTAAFASAVAASRSFLASIKAS